MIIPNVVEKVVSANAVVEKVGSVVVEEGFRGLVLPEGSSVSNTAMVAAGVAGSALSGHRLVTLDGGRFRYIDPTNSADGHVSLFLTLNSANENETIYPLASGLTSEVSWNWPIGSPIFCGPNGSLSAVAPSGVSFVRVVGYSTSSTQIQFAPQPAIFID